MRLLILVVMLIVSLAFARESDAASTEEIRRAALAAVDKSRAAVQSITLEVADPFLESQKEDVLRVLKQAVGSVRRKDGYFPLADHFLLVVSLNEAIVTMDDLRRDLRSLSRDGSEDGKMARSREESLKEITREVGSAALNAEFELASRLVDVEFKLADYERVCGKIVP